MLTKETETLRAWQKLAVRQSRCRSDPNSTTVCTSAHTQPALTGDLSIAGNAWQARLA